MESKNKLVNELYFTTAWSKLPVTEVIIQ